MDLKRWNVFRHLDPAFVADVDRAYLVGIDSYHDEARASGKLIMPIFRSLKQPRLILT